MGEVVDNTKHGLGVLAAGGRKYEGEFHEDEPAGLGRLTFDNGDVYYGQTVKLARTGPGRMEYADPGPGKARLFEGQFEQDKRDGVGFRYLDDGRVYCGQFRNGLEEGLGEYLNQSEGIDMNYAKVNMPQIEQILDQIAKQTTFLAPLGIKGSHPQPSVRF